MKTLYLNNTNYPVQIHPITKCLMKTSSNAVLLNCNDTETPTQKTPEIYRFKNSFSLSGVNMA